MINLRYWVILFCHDKIRCSLFVKYTLKNLLFFMLSYDSYMNRLKEKLHFQAKMNKTWEALFISLHRLNILKTMAKYLIFVCVYRYIILFIYEHVNVHLQTIAIQISLLETHKHKSILRYWDNYNCMLTVIKSKIVHLYLV